jgi:hypothetical protein
MKKTILSLNAAVAMLLVTTLAFGHKHFTTEPIGVFLNGKQINLVKDSLEITAKGKMSLSTLSPEYKNGERVKFRIVVRHTTYNGSIPFLSYDIRYRDGEEFLEVEIEKILNTATVGDVILIIPVKDPKFENSKQPFEIYVTAEDRC